MVDYAATPGWQYAAYAALALVVLANYFREQRAKRRTVPAVVVPIDPRDLCANLDCGNKATKEWHGVPLCDDDYAERVAARILA